jgi:hypothetical protein
MPFSNTSRSDKGSARDSRSSSRTRCLGVRSSLGEVVDFSRLGARVRTRSRPTIRKGQRFDLSLVVLGRKVSVGARATWIRKCAWRRWEIGLEFVSVGKEASRSFQDLARAEAINERVVPRRRAA